MAISDQGYLRVILWLKIVLPLVALAILSTLFLLARRIDPADAIPYASVDVEDLAREPRLTAPEYAGVTSDGSAVTVTALAAVPGTDGSGGVVATGIHAVMDDSRGLRIEITAAKGEIDGKANLLVLSEGARVTLSSGYTLAVGALRAAMDRTEITAEGPVVATAPFGQLTAQSMELRALSADKQSHVLVFNGDVRLIYIPQSEGPTP